MNATTKINNINDTKENVMKRINNVDGIKIVKNINNVAGVAFVGSLLGGAVSYAAKAIKPNQVFQCVRHGSAVIYVATGLIEIGHAMYKTMKEVEAENADTEDDDDEYEDDDDEYEDYNTTDETEEDVEADEDNLLTPANDTDYNISDEIANAIHEALDESNDSNINN